MEKFWPVFLSASIAVIIVSIIYCVTIGYCINRDIDSVVSRATIAANQKDMAEHVETLKENMEQHKMTVVEIVGVVFGSSFVITLGVIIFFAFREGIIRYFMQ